MRTLTTGEAAAELGRSQSWLYDNWRRLIREQKMPKPVSEGSHLAWNAAQFYAWLDRDLPAGQRAAAAGFRAAIFHYHAASVGARQEASVAEHHTRLMDRFSNP